jgi:hypothetical protein
VKGPFLTFNARKDPFTSFNVRKDPFLAPNVRKGPFQALGGGSQLLDQWTVMPARSQVTGSK